LFFVRRFTDLRISVSINKFSKLRSSCPREASDEFIGSFPAALLAIY